MKRKGQKEMTEPMFYVLMAFLRSERCGIEVADFVARQSDGRVTLGPGTLYTILGRFEEQQLIQQTEVQGRKRTYRITEKGRAAYQDELRRLHACLNDAAEIERTITPPAGVLEVQR